MKRWIDRFALPVGAVVGVLMAFVPTIFPPPRAQVIAPAPVTLYFSVYKRTTGGPVQYVWFGPDASPASCINNAMAITNAPAGIGSTAWGYSPVNLCYPTTSWAAP